MAKQILIAEDNQPVAEVMEFLLLDAGWEVLVAKDGTEALQLLREHTPSLCILDVMMPGADGFAVAHEIRKQERLNQTHILFLTALGEERHRREGYAQGAEQYLTKPFDNQDLLARVREILE